MTNKNGSLIDLVAPVSGSTVMIYDVHASESGALAILNDLYNHIRNYQDKTVKWVFVVSTPEYEETENITVVRFPWVKKSWFHRYYFDNITTRKLLKAFCPDQVFSLQNMGIPFYHKRQLVYLHLPFILTEHKFKIKEDGKTLWAYQNIISKGIFKSLRKVDTTIVQTLWMKEALVRKGRVSAEKIVIQYPNITTNNIGTFKDVPENRKRFFYPATAFTYKNHLTLLKALKSANLTDYELILTIKKDESEYTKSLYRYVIDNNLNVKFGGPIPRESVFEMYQKSILLFPSYVESFGLPLLEARLSGTYVIASDCPFSREILDGYDKAMFFTELDFETMGKLISKVAQESLKGEVAYNDN